MFVAHVCSYAAAEGPDLRQEVHVCRYTAAEGPDLRQEVHVCSPCLQLRGGRRSRPPSGGPCL